MSRGLLSGREACLLKRDILSGGGLLPLPFCGFRGCPECSASSSSLNMLFANAKPSGDILGLS